MYAVGTHEKKKNKKTRIFLGVEKQKQNPGLPQAGGNLCFGAQGPAFFGRGWGRQLGGPVGGFWGGGAPVGAPPGGGGPPLSRVCIREPNPQRHIPETVYIFMVFFFFVLVSHTPPKGYIGVCSGTETGCGPPVLKHARVSDGEQPVPGPGGEITPGNTIKEKITETKKKTKLRWGGPATGLRAL